MSKFLLKISLIFIALFFICSSGSIHAQITDEEWENIFSQANETAIYNNGKIVSLEQTILSIGDKLFTFTPSEDGKPLTITDENGISLQISFYQDGRMQSVEMPDGERLTVVWTKNSSNNWTAQDLNCGNNARPAPPSNPCRDAVVAIGLAAFICSTHPGTATCWAATANAAYQTYKCYESTRLAFDPKKIKSPNIYGVIPKFVRKTRKEGTGFRKSNMSKGE